VKYECGCEITYEENKQFPRGHLVKKFCEKHQPKPSMTLAELYGFRMRFLEKVVEEVEREEDFPFIAPRGEIAVLEDERS